ncbi:MAG: hypothetical protein RI953_2626 [Pseudomonadota bacterium]|jgi:hypothetical protein
MLKTTGIIKLTLRENLRGQLLWTSAISGCVLLVLMAVLSGVALSHEARVIDIISYFAADQLLLFVALLSGSSICSNDFSSRGIAELYIPAGATRQSVYLARLIAYAAVLLMLATALFALKIFALPGFSEINYGMNFQIQVLMLFYSWLKGIAALAIAGLLGSLVRPLYAVLATVTLFSFGHLTSSLDSLVNSGIALNPAADLSQTNLLLLGLLKIWNPNLLVLESARGEWIFPPAQQIAQAAAWAICCILISTGLAFARINKIDLRP